jgi:hypothetical protein
MCVQAIFALQDLMRGVDYLTPFSSSGHYEQTKALLDLGKQHINSDRVGSAPQPSRGNSDRVGSAPQPSRGEEANAYDDFSNPYWRNRDDENEPPNEPFGEEDNDNNWAPPEPENQSAMELRIPTIEQELTLLAEQHRNVNVTNHHKPHIAELQLYEPMIHSVAPSSSNITFYPNILPPPNLTGSTTVILAISAQSNFRKRQAIRETWAQGHDNVYFIVGHSNCHENMEIQIVDRTHCQEKDHAFLIQEQLRFRDLIEVPIIEFYRGIPEKVVQAYHWSLTHLPLVRWLVKADDDMFVRVQSVETYLQKYNSYLPMLIGRIIMESAVNREGKWAEEDYPYVYYPYWPQGSAGHIMSRPTAEYIVDNSLTLHRYQGEDVSIGIWLDEAKDKKGMLTNLQYIHVPRLVQNEGKQHCQEGTYLMIGHDMKPRDLEHCMKSLASDELPPIRAWMDDSAQFGPPNRESVVYNGNAKQAGPSNAANYAGFRNIFQVPDQERRARLRLALGAGDKEDESNR